MSDSLKIGGLGLGGGAAGLGAAQLSLQQLTKSTQAIDSIKEKSAQAVESKDHSKASKAAHDFEALLLQQMFATMWQTVPQNELFPEGQGTDFYRDMLNQQLAESVSEKQSLGIADMVIKDMERSDKFK